MERIERAAHWIRGNAAVLALIVTVLTFIGGVFGGIGAAAWYFSTLATTEHVTATVNAAIEPLDEAVDSLNGTVDTTVNAAIEPLDEAVDSLNGTVDSLSGTVDDLRETVGDLGGTVRGLETSVGALNALSSTVETLSGMVNMLNGTVQNLGGSVDTLNTTFPRLVSCVIELHGPWIDDGGADVRPYRPGSYDSSLERLELPRTCGQARELTNPPAATGR